MDAWFILSSAISILLPLTVMVILAGLIVWPFIYRHKIYSKRIKVAFYISGIPFVVLMLTFYLVISGVIVTHPRLELALYSFLLSMPVFFAGLLGVVLVWLNKKINGFLKNRKSFFL